MTDYLLQRYMAQILTQTPTSFKRYLYEAINWDADMQGIVGPRGVGKSTLLQQYILANRGDGKFLYVTADHSYFINQRLADLADQWVLEGGTHLFIDEVHRYPNWSRELKEIYDLHHNHLKVVFTGSSMLDIFDGVADLSRRAVIHNMQGLSLREYMAMFHSVKLPVLAIGDVDAHNYELPAVVHPLPLLREYLQKGYYPFSASTDFNQRLQQTVGLTLDVDIPQYTDLKAQTARKIRQMLVLVAQMVPFKPNIKNLATEIGVSINNVGTYLEYLRRAGLIDMLRDDTAGLRGLGKAEKIYLDNPNLMYALVDGQPNVGTLRETFFYNQTRVKHNVTSSKISNFNIDGTSYEIGGKSKTGRQLQQAEHGIVVRDDIERGFSNFTPLWAYGMLY